MSCRQDYTFISWLDPNLGINARLIEIDPAVIDFGHVDPSTSAARQVTLTNVGVETLYLDEVYTEGSESFSAQAPASDRLGAGESTTVVVTYNPPGFERATASLVIRSSDPILPRLTGGLAGRSIPPKLVFSPPAFDFGQEFVGCPLSHTLTVSNAGEGKLLITELGLSQDNPEFRVGFASAVPLPLSLGPGEAEQITLNYRPGDEGSDEISIVARSNDPDRPEAQAPAYGYGRLEGHVKDLFDQVANNRTDILFVVDNSFSMNEEQATLACNFETFLNVVDALEIDYQIGVITTDSPVLQGEEKVITPDSIQPTVTFATNAQVGVDGFGQEQGMEMARQALSYPLSASQNEGFLRPQAGLRLIFVSDEDDQSPLSIQEYMDFFTGLKANPNDVIASAIVGDPGGGCGFQSAGRVMSEALPETATAAACPLQECGRASGGDRYMEAVQLSEGVFGSICSCNFIEALESIAFETVHLVSTFFLTQNPIVETLQVWVDEVPSDTWRYDETLNAIVFDDPLEVPTNGSRLRVEYDLRAYCDD